MLWNVPAPAVDDGRSLPWRFWGRVVRPFSLAVSAATAVVTVWLFANGAMTSLLVGLSAIATTLLLWGGWWVRSAGLMTQGLLLASAVWSSSALLLWHALRSSGTLMAAVVSLLAVCWAIASAGSWLLEVNVPRGRRE